MGWDFRYSPKGWECFSFVDSHWNKINKAERKLYLKNAYWVLLTRARQGMVIVVPEGDAEGCRKYHWQETPYSSQIVRAGSKKFGKQKDQFITVREFSLYTGIDEDLVREFLLD